MERMIRTLVVVAVAVMISGKFAWACCASLRRRRPQPSRQPTRCLSARSPKSKRASMS